MALLMAEQHHSKCNIIMLDKWTEYLENGGQIKALYTCTVTSKKHSTKFPTVA